MYAQTNPGLIGSRGTTLLEAAKAIDTALVKRELAAFSAVHSRWLAAQEKVETARSRELDTRLSRSELDAEQDRLVDDLARALVGDGFSRTSPLKPFGVPSPNVLKSLGDSHEAKKARALASAVLKDRRTSPATRKIAQALDKAAAAVAQASQRIDPVAKATSAQRQQRDALMQQWARAYSVLKLAARLAEEAGGPALASTLFPAKPKRAAKVKKAPAAPATPA